MINTSTRCIYCLEIYREHARCLTVMTHHTYYMDKFSQGNYLIFKNGILLSNAAYGSYRRIFNKIHYIRKSNHPNYIELGSKLR